ncbi:hypothetical protein J3D54_003938 [Pseudomonas sp. GGS8]|nr:hypothetical protein [Pseudomonas sp. GGS8]
MICVEQVVEQVALLRADLLAALGKPVPLEDGDLVGQLLDDGLIAVDLSAHGVDLRHQLRSECTQLVGGHLVEVGRGRVMPWILQKQIACGSRPRR